MPAFHGHQGGNLKSRTPRKRTSVTIGVSGPLPGEKQETREAKLRSTKSAWERNGNCDAAIAQLVRRSHRGLGNDIPRAGNTPACSPNARWGEGGSQLVQRARRQHGKLLARRRWEAVRMGRCRCVEGKMWPPAQTSWLFGGLDGSLSSQSARGGGNDRCQGVSIRSCGVGGFGALCRSVPPLWRRP